MRNAAIDDMICTNVVDWHISDESRTVVSHTPFWLMVKNDNHIELWALFLLGSPSRSLSLLEGPTNTWFGSGSWSQHDVEIRPHFFTCV